MPGYTANQVFRKSLAIRPWFPMWERTIFETYCLNTSRYQVSSYVAIFHLEPVWKQSKNIWTVQDGMPSSPARKKVAMGDPNCWRPAWCLLRQMIHHGGAPSDEYATAINSPCLKPSEALSLESNKSTSHILLNAGSKQKVMRWWCICDVSSHYCCAAMRLLCIFTHEALLVEWMDQLRRKSRKEPTWHSEGWQGNHEGYWRFRLITLF